MKRSKLLCTVIVALGLLILIPAQALACDAAAAALSPSDIQRQVERADALIERAIGIAQHLADNTTLDDAVIAQWLVWTTNEIIRKTVERVGAENVVLYPVTVRVGDLYVEVDPMKVAGE